MGAVGILGEVDFVTVSLVGLSLSMTLQVLIFFFDFFLDMVHYFVLVVICETSYIS